MSAPTLRTPRTDLRPLTAADLDAAHALWTDPDVRRYLWDDVVITREGAAEALARSDGDFASHGFGLWAVYQRHGGPLARLLRLSDSPRVSRPNCSMACSRRGGARGWPLKPPAPCSITCSARSDTPRSVALTDVANTASVRVMERLGMTFERRGEHHGLDTLFYRLRSADWTATADRRPPGHARRRAAAVVVDAAAGRLSRDRRGGRRWRSIAAITPCCSRRCTVPAPIHSCSWRSGRRDTRVAWRW